MNRNLSRCNPFVNQRESDALPVSCRVLRIARSEKMFERFGPVTVFFARFVFGMRVIAGPLAGVLRMHWRRFALFNFLGASLWVTVISCVGYFFGRHWGRLLQVVGRANALVFVVAVVVAWVLWRRYRRGRSEVDQ